MRFVDEYKKSIIVLQCRAKRSSEESDHDSCCCGKNSSKILLCPLEKIQLQFLIGFCILSCPRIKKSLEHTCMGVQIWKYEQNIGAQIRSMEYKLNLRWLKIYNVLTTKTGRRTLFWDQKSNNSFFEEISFVFQVIMEWNQKSHQILCTQLSLRNKGNSRDLKEGLCCSCFFFEKSLICVWDKHGFTDLKNWSVGFVNPLCAENKYQVV